MTDYPPFNPDCPGYCFGCTEPTCPVRNKKEEREYERIDVGKESSIEQH